MNIDALNRLTSSLTDEALAEIQSAYTDAPPEKDKYFKTSIHFLTRSKEYVDGAWQMLAAEKAYAAVCLSRWVLEAALNLFWVVANSEDTDWRLTDLCREALRNEASLVENLVAFWPNLAHPLNAEAAKAKQVRTDLGAERGDFLQRKMEEYQAAGESQMVRQMKRKLDAHKRLPSLEVRMRGLEASGSTSKLDDLGRKNYALYKTCCSAAHAGLNIWESPDSTLLTPERARHIAAVSPLYLVMAAHVLTGTGDIRKVERWWSDTVEPLLGY